MKNLLILLSLISVSAFSQVRNLDKETIQSSVFETIETDTIFFSKDSTYITGSGDTIKLVVDDNNTMHLTDKVVIPYIASPNTVVLSPTSTGNIDTLETTDLATEDITVTGDWTFDNIVLDTSTFENSATIHNGETDTLFLTETVVKVIGQLIATGYLLPERIVHSYLAFSDSSVSPVMTQNNWAQVTNTHDSLFRVLETDDITYVNGDSLFITVQGDYKGIVTLYFSGANGDDYEMAVFKNGALETTKAESTQTSNSVVGMALPLYVEGLVYGDLLTLEIRNVANDNDATIIGCVWYLELAHTE